MGPGDSVTTGVFLERNRVTELWMGFDTSFDDGPLHYVDKRCRNSK